MSPRIQATLLAACFALLAPVVASGAKQTVCTITVNSADEKDVFRRYLPADRYEFVELVERGRPDWLASSCKQGVKCDVLIISGHFNGEYEFYSDQVAVKDRLPVAEMERVSCSGSCPGLFSQLKEVYMFGCDTLSAETSRTVPPELVRSLQQSGHSRPEAERIARSLAQMHNESSRDRMRRIFPNVPVIYGFSSVAPLGPTSASLLGRYFQSAGSSELTTGRTSARLLGQFSAHGLAAASGMRAGDPRATYSQEMCRFADDRLAAAEKLRFVHALLGREMAEVRMFFERIEQLMASVPPDARTSPDFVQALEAIAQDRSARKRYLDFARDADQPPVRARMVDVAAQLGWLTPDQLRAERLGLVADLLARRSMGASEVDLVCALNRDRSLDGELPRLDASRIQAGRVAQAATQACLGDVQAHAQVIDALSSADPGDLQIAQVYLRHRPVTDPDELRDIASSVARMSNPAAQTRALESLAQLRASDPEMLQALVRLFPQTASLQVQRAIAGVLIRSDYDALDIPGQDLVRMVSQSRLKSPDGEDAIDVLIRRLKASL